MSGSRSGRRPRTPLHENCPLSFGCRPGEGPPEASRGARAATASEAMPGAAAARVGGGTGRERSDRPLATGHPAPARWGPELRRGSAQARACGDRCALTRPEGRRVKLGEGPAGGAPPQTPRHGVPQAWRHPPPRIGPTGSERRGGARRRRAGGRSRARAGLRVGEGLARHVPVRTCPDGSTGRDRAGWIFMARGSPSDPARRRHFADAPEARATGDFLCARRTPLFCARHARTSPADTVVSPSSDTAPPGDFIVTRSPPI